MDKPKQAEAQYYCWPESGLLRVAGPHSKDFLQRQTTNDVQLLTQESALSTILTNPTARILDVLTLYLDEAPGNTEPVITVLTLPGRAAATASHLKSRIFFMDRVTVENTSAEYVQIDLAGPRAGEKLSLLGLPAVPQPGEVLPGKVDGTSLHVIGHLPGGGPGYRLILPTGALQPVQHVLEASGVFRQTHEEYETWRVEAGLPGKNELSEEYTPLEVGLQAAISDRKGCYTGQEVIARQLTYDKVTRHLVGLRLEAPAPVGSLALAEGKPAGVITSSVRSPAFGPIALAVLRRPYNQSGTQVVVRPEGNEIKGMVTTLPFEPHNL